MKYASLVRNLIVACSCLVATGLGTSAATASDSGHLLIYRGAKFGYRLNLVLSVDGNDVATLSEGQTYDSYLPAGQHVIAARVTPRSAAVNLAEQTLAIEAGHTYSYIALLSGKYLVLAKKK